MYAGRIIEDLPTNDLHIHARHPYTRALPAAVPDMTTDRHQPLATIPGHPVDPAHQPPGCAFAPRCPRVGTGRNTDDLSIPSGQILGLAGDSGSGKSTLARAAAGLTPTSSGRILLDGEPLRHRRRQPPQMVFQDPYSSLDPRMTIGDSTERTDCLTATPTTDHLNHAACHYAATTDELQPAG